MACQWMLFSVLYKQQSDTVALPSRPRDCRCSWPRCSVASLRQEFLLGGPEGRPNASLDLMLDALAQLPV